ncbi:MAG: M6 family metalloprotease domain-containing protein, partial [Candidatus Neomarinimicrobiota bacterium]|nr:M6 family metalloprotease domain-containing protein [Candidatus Neomarinimicrobiota bacterium]
MSEVTNWITAPNSHDYYGYNNPNGWQHVQQLVRAMVDSLEAQGFDWSLYDNDNDGYVDALNLLHQGEGAEQGDYSNIWSHKSSLGNLSVIYDGVIISSYTMNPEIQSGTIVAIGVLAHEFGHALGLPDLYDTDYSSTGAGKLALMASGSWGTSGNSPWYPATMIGWCKNRLGWANIVEITENADLISLQQSYSNNNIIRVNHTQVSEEYWL